MKKLLNIRLFTILGFTVFALLLYGLTIRGHLGIPTPKQIEFEQNGGGHPFETSQERSRYALLLSMVHEKTFAIDKYASMGTPDIGQINGHYFSFFPPGASILAIPLYLLGLKVGAAQMAVFSVSTIFALATMILMLKFAFRIGLHWTIAVFSAVAFGFATNAWGYSVTLYAHLISAFLLLLGLYVTVFFTKSHSFKTAAAVWLIYALAVFIDFPNLFIFLPVVTLLSLNAFNVTNDKEKKSYDLEIRWKYVLAPIVFVLLMAAYGYYNYVNFGDPLKLSNTIPRVKDLKEVVAAMPEGDRRSVGALNPRNMLEGFRSFLISHDRSLVVFSPVVLLFIFGVGYLKETKKLINVGLIAIPVTCLVMYTMFGDPYGGWAFGSRYMIASLPALCLLAGVGLQRFYKNIFIKLFYSLVFIYSAAVSLLAPLTTNVIPPYVEARGSNFNSFYTLNIDMLKDNQLNSFVYNHVLQGSISGVQYYFVILSIVVLAAMVLIWLPKKAYEAEQVSLEARV